jgi:hypothetical protein
LADWVVEAQFDVIVFGTNREGEVRPLAGRVRRGFGFVSHLHGTSFQDIHHGLPSETVPLAHVNEDELLKREDDRHHVLPTHFHF